MIKTVIFDFFDVLTFGEAGWDYVAEELERASGVPKEMILKQLYSEETKYILGQENTLEFWKNVCGKLNIEISIEEFSNILGSYELNPEILSVLRDLKNTHQLILLSDNTPIASEIIKNDGRISSLFDKMFFSNEAGLTKRNKSRKFYEYALTELHRKPDECIFVDDREDNIEAAREAGLRTILYRNAAQLKQELGVNLKMN